MPVQPTKLQGSGGNIVCPGVNLCTIQKVEDTSQASTKDLQLDIVFGFVGAPDDWVRRWRWFGTFEKDAHGNIDPNSSDVKMFYTRMAMLGFTDIEFDERGNIKALNGGICLSDKGKFVMADDKPIKDIGALMTHLSKDKQYSVTMHKNAKGYDDIVTAIAEDVSANDAYAYLFNLWMKRSNDILKKAEEEASKPAERSNPADDYEVVPGM
jgi:hypothetical protein